MAFDDALARRLRDRLAGADGVTEKKMFGGLAFLTHGNMTVGVHGDGLIVRLDRAETDAALARPGVRLFDISGRPMPGLGAAEVVVATQEVHRRPRHR